MQCTLAYKWRPLSPTREFAQPYCESKRVRDISSRPSRTIHTRAPTSLQRKIGTMREPARRRRILIVGLAGSFLAISSLLLVTLTETLTDGQPFTEFYVLGPSGYADDYPNEIEVDQEAILIMGIVNHENTTVDYRVQATLDGDPAGLALTTNGEGAVTISGSVFELPDILDEDEWEHGITVTPLLPGENQKLKFLLFSSLPRSACILRAPLEHGGYVSLQLDERGGETNVRTRAAQTCEANCRVEAWQDGSPLAEKDMQAEAGEEERFILHHPPGRTLFRSTTATR